MSEINEWKEIPGYPNYQINTRTLTVKNIPASRDLVIRKGMVQLRGDMGSITINMPRLLFCVNRNINPNAVPRDILIVLDGGYPVAYDRKEYMSTKTKDRYAKTNKTPIESYSNAREWINTVILAIQTKDYTHVIKELYGYSDKLIGHVMRNGVMRNENDAKELASAAIERTLTSIISGTLVFFPYQYMYGAARGIAGDIHRAKKATREFVRSNSNYRSYDEARSI